MGRRVVVVIVGARKCEVGVGGCVIDEALIVT